MGKFRQTINEISSSIRERLNKTSSDITDLPSRSRDKGRVQRELNYAMRLQNGIDKRMRGKSGIYNQKGKS